MKYICVPRLERAFSFRTEFNLSDNSPYLFGIGVFYL